MELGVAIQLNNVRGVDWLLECEDLRLEKFKVFCLLYMCVRVR